MNAYRVKEVLWLFIILMFVVIALTGCSSAPKQSRLVSDQYCHTSQTIKSQNKEVVSSETVVQCSDDPVAQYVPAKLGIAADCQQAYIPINVGGRVRQEKVYACQKFDGTYSIVDSRTMR